MYRKRKGETCTRLLVEMCGKDRELRNVQLRRKKKAGNREDEEAGHLKCWLKCNGFWMMMMWTGYNILFVKKKVYTGYVESGRVCAR